MENIEGHEGDEDRENVPLENIKVEIHNSDELEGPETPSDFIRRRTTQKLNHLSMTFFGEKIDEMMAFDGTNDETPSVKTFNIRLISAAFHGQEEKVDDLLENCPSGFSPRMCLSESLPYNALHLAIIADKIKCVEAILSRGNLRDEWLGMNTFEENSPLHLAAIFNRLKIAKFLIRSGASLSAINAKKEMALTLVSRKLPGALDSIESMLDSFFTVYRNYKNNEETVQVKMDKFKKMTGKIHSAKYGLSLLSCFITCNQTKYLNHPLCQIILRQNWKRLKSLLIARLVLSFLLLLTMTTYIMVFHGFDCNKTTETDSSDDSDGFFMCSEKSPEWILSLQRSTACQIIITMVYYTLIPMTFMDILRKMTGLMSIANSRFTPQGKTIIWHYVCQFDNWFEWISTAGIFYLFFWEQTENSWHKTLAPLVMVVTWANFMHLVGQFHLFGVYVEMYITVLKIFVELFGVYCIILIGYALSFYMFFKTEGTFSDPLKAMWKTLAMMIGDLEYNDLFSMKIRDNATANHSNGNDLSHYDSFSMAHFIYVTFLLTTSVVLMNLLIGIVVHDINEIKKSASTTKLIRNTRVVLYLDTSSRSLKKIFRFRKSCDGGENVILLKQDDAMFHDLFQEAQTAAIKNQESRPDYVDKGDSGDERKAKQLMKKAEEMQLLLSDVMKLLGNRIQEH